ncbi:MAG: YqaA family protein [archaeon]
MGLFNSVLIWTQNTFLPLGEWGLFILAFMESSFFPIPPDVLLIILTLANPKLGLLYALICTVGSVLGAMFGYGIGYAGEKIVLEKMFRKDKIDRVHRLFDKYGAWAIAIAAFTPLPFKIFTIAAGVFYINFKKFVIASTIGRGARFFLLAGFLMVFGEMIVNMLNTYLNWISIIAVAVLVIVYLLYKKRKKIDHYYVH